MSGTAHFGVFSYLTAEKSAVYRAILLEFVRAKSRFLIHLRPAEVERALRSSGKLTDPDLLIEPALQQLAEWGNLESHPDTSEVATVEDFWRVRHLYQMSIAGEAAEQAITLFEQSLEQPGELQSAALDDIRRQLIRIQEFAAGELVDDVELAGVFSLLRQRFDDLTTQAQRFMGGVQRRADLQSLDIEAFLEYKRRLIDYLERFLRELVMVTHAITTCVRSLDPVRVTALLERVADHELIDRLIVTEPERAERRQAWAERWDGLCNWFIGSEDRRSQAEELRAAARSAIPALIATVSGINDRRAGHSDRSADYATLARWFAEAETDDDAHRLWRAAFSLSSCRHLSIDQETLAERDDKPITSTTSWLEAPPLRISPRLRKSGRYSARGRVATVVDRTREKAALARLIADEAAQINRAMQTLCTGQSTRLSALAELNETEFHLLLDLIGDALAAKHSPEAGVSVTSSDGTMRIDLHPTRDGKTAILRTTTGELRGDDHHLMISAIGGMSRPRMVTDAVPVSVGGDTP